MGYNNHNAGMHFVRYGCNVFEPYEYNRYADIMNEHMMKKELVKKAEESAEFVDSQSSDPKMIDAPSKPLPTKSIEKNDRIGNLYKDACNQASRLYAMLFLYSVKSHNNLKEISRTATEYIKGKSVDNSIDDMLFLSMTSKMIGMNIGQLASACDDDIKDIVYNHILYALNEHSIIQCVHSEKEDYMEAFLSLIDYSKENDVRDYYMSLRYADSADKISLLPDIRVDYEITFYRIKDNDKPEYAVTISIKDYEQDNYLNWYEAIVYTEKEGKLADFFENT